MSTITPPDEESIFAAALGFQSSGERSAFLQVACGGDEQLIERVKALLRSHEQAGPFLNEPAVARDTIALPPREELGSQIGCYKLVEPIGEGGFGIVYLAEQQSPVRRRVALKVIKPGMDTREVIARFEAERQALALMEHPNIAKVLDAGTTSGGRPYFVMELVQGVPITDYCNQCNLTTRERLELFVTLCQAVQHAHQKGVIHRDIKPTNVLVMIQDGRPAPKIIDFGVAKALNQRLTEQTLATGFAQMIGTPLYMSPEQAELSPMGADTRSDVYSLGVLLYELLTGTTPFDKARLHAAGYDELRRILREEEPPRPSVRLTTLAAELATTIVVERRTNTHRLVQQVRGELDWIVMRCLEKDRNRRYETANELAVDIQRYLNNEPVLACPPSPWYRLSKFVRRNKRAMLAVLLVLLTLLGSTFGATWSLIREQQQSRALQAANDRARQAIEAVMSEAALDQLARQPELRPEQKDFLDKMLEYYAASTKGAADTREERSRQQQAYYRMGRLNQILGRSQVSEVAYRRAVALGTQLVADFPTQPDFRQELAASYNALGVLLSMDRSQEKAWAYGEALSILKQLAADYPARQEFRQTLAGVQSNLGNLFVETGRPKEAEAAHAEALAIRTQLSIDFPTGRNIHRALAGSHNNLGWIFKSTNRPEQAETSYRDAVALQRQQLAESPNQPQFRLELAKYLFNLSDVLGDNGKSEEARTARAEAVAIFTQLVAEYPTWAEFRQEMEVRGLQEEDLVVGNEREEDTASGAPGAIVPPNQ